MSITKKFIIITSISIITMMFISNYFFYQKSYNSLKREFQTDLLSIVQTASLNIKGDDHNKINSLDDVSKKPFQKITKYLKKVMMLNHLTPETLYTFKINPDKELIWCVMLHKKPFVGEMYKQSEYTKKIIQKVIEGKAQTTDIYKDQHGHWISAYAPIKDKNNKVVGILEADFKLETFLKQNRKEFYQLLETQVVIAILSIITLLFFTRKIIKPIKALKKASRLIANGNYNIDITINRKDEFGELQQSFIQMAKSLEERFHMLKYISPHTLDMIQRVLKNEINEKGERRNTVILFSDIRGFTNYSSTRTPEEIIHMLNHILGLQSSIIEKYNGDIDKFVGDEIVAVFNGEYAIVNAIEASIAMHIAINTCTIINSLIQVGIGISLGEVVFGNIGGENRKDFTIIGSEVNLTSRLCSQANAGQTIVSTNVITELETLNKKNDYIFSEEGFVNLKGFKDPIQVYAINKLKK